MRTKFWEHMTGLPVIACKVGKRGGLEKCGQDMKMYQSNIVLNTYSPKLCNDSLDFASICRYIK